MTESNLKWDSDEYPDTTEIWEDIDKIGKCELCGCINIRIIRSPELDRDLCVKCEDSIKTKSNNTWERFIIHQHLRLAEQYKKCHSDLLDMGRRYIDTCEGERTHWEKHHPNPKSCRDCGNKINLGENEEGTEEGGTKYRDYSKCVGCEEHPSSIKFIRFHEINGYPTP